MPIILPKCPTGYELNKDNCRCKKKSATKKKAPKKVNKTVKKKKLNVMPQKKENVKQKVKYVIQIQADVKIHLLKKLKRKRNLLLKRK